MEELSLSPKKSLGQNFLIDKKGVSKIVQHVKLTNNPYLLEIGPGLGALTDHFVKWERSLVLMELDSVLAEYWRNQGQRVIECDALKYRWTDWKEGNLTLVSNLPYQISSRLMVDISVKAPYVKDMVLMFQKEVAERILAYPRNKDYGFLSVISQSFWCVSRGGDLASVAFYPRPQVASRVLLFSRLPVEVDVKKFVGFVKCGFSHRRKLLAKNLLSAGVVEPEKVLEALGQRGVRAEELTPRQFMELFNKVM